MPSGGKVDWEVELVVVIGRRAHRVGADEALDYVAGYAVGQDVSERSLQLAASRLSSAWASRCPATARSAPGWSPSMTSPTRTTLSSAARSTARSVQLSRTSQLIFSVPALIENLSASVPLLPGDVIFTGTPSGVGLGRKPPRYLADGDVLTTHIESIGADAASLRRRWKRSPPWPCTG